MSGAFRYADLVQPCAERQARLASSLLGSIYEHARIDRPVIDAVFKRVTAALRAGDECNGVRFNVYCNLLADYLVGLRGQLHDEMARRDLAGAIGRVVETCVYRMLSQYDGVPIEVIERELAEFGVAP